MKRLSNLVPMLLASVALVSCLGQNDSTTHIVAINLVTDSPTLALEVDTTAVSTVSYGGMSSLAAAHPGSHALQVAGVVPSDLVTQPVATYAPFGTPINETLADGSSYIVVAYGTTADPKYFLTTSTTLTNGVPDNTVIYQVIDAAPNGPPVDVYISAPGAGVADLTKVASLTFQQSTAETPLTIALPAGQLNTGATLSANFTIELRNSATGATIIPASTITVAEQNRLLFVIADNLGPGATPIVIDALVGATGVAAPGSQLANPADNAELAFANVCGDCPVFTVIGGLSLEDTLAPSVAFGQKSSYQHVPGNSAGTIAAPVSDPTALTFISSFTSTPDGSYTEYAVGPLETVLGVTLSDDRRSVPTQGEFRILNAATSLQFGPAIDIYYATVGTVFDITAQNTSRPAPNFPAVVFKNSTVYTQLTPGTYDVYIANTGTSDIILGPVAVVVTAGANVTYALVDEPGKSGTYELLPFHDERTTPNH